MMNGASRPIRGLGVGLRNLFEAAESIRRAAKSRSSEGLRQLRKAVDLLPWYAPWRWGSRIPEGIPDELRKHGFEVCRQVVYDPATGSVC